MSRVESIRITRILPCLADPAKVRARADISTDVSDLLPYLNATEKGAIYNPVAHTLTLRQGGMIITIYPREIVMAKVDDAARAEELAGEFRDLLNRTEEQRGDVEPCFERRSQLQPLDILKLLPRTNCRQCGDAVCLAFATKLALGQADIMRCGPLFDADWTEQRHLLLELLDAAGYSVPAEFLPPRR